MKKFILSSLFLSALISHAQTLTLLVGTCNYTSSSKTNSIYVYRFNAATGKAEKINETTDSISNPSFLVLSSNSKFAYAVNETDSGTVTAFAFDKSSGKLTFINKQSIAGDAPCHIAISKSNTWLLVSNYGSGNITALSVNKDGSLNPFSQTIKHTGGNENSKVQKTPHVHEAVFTPGEDYVLVPDLGADRVVIYKFNPLSNTPLTPAKQPFIAVKKGNGPRHITIHPNKKFAYLIEELTGTVGAYKYHKGPLSFIQNIPAHPESFKGPFGSAEVVVSPDGKFLYASNRGSENNIAIFSIDQTTGKLSLKGYQATSGKAPRSFIVDPSGKYLVVANLDSNNMVVFSRNSQTGLLKIIGKPFEALKPSCVALVKQW